MTACPRCGFADPSRRLSVCPRCLLAGAGDVLDVPDLSAAGLTILDELGAGGMGRVFRARDERLGRDVAVKVLRPESAADPDFRARFAREARTLARLEHPGIVAIHDFGTAPGGDAYLVMQFVAGGSLAERGPLPAAEAMGVARQLCDALEYAHGRGIIHRDIKPENVLLAENGRAKLSDFGIARLVDRTTGARTTGERTLTRPSVVLGTPGYLPPEAHAGAPPDARGDVFALGALLFFMVTGRDPDGSALAAGPSGPALPGTAAALGPVIARAMALDPSRRTPSAAVLASELDAVAARLAAPVAADDLPPEERTWRGAVALLAAVATAIAIYAGLVSFTPRVVAADDALPFTTFGSQRLPDGRLLTRARFETGPTLGAAVAMALALGAYGLLRRHWRLAGLDRREPERPLAGSRRVLNMGVVLFVLFLLHAGLARSGAAGIVTYAPVLGGVLELMMLQRFWDVALEARRTSRLLAREPWLWVGVALSLFPPAYHMVLFARGLGVL